MKSQNRVSPSNISQLTLELYHRGLATNKERRLAEKAIETDSETRKRYEALQESDRAIRQLVTQELKRFKLPESPPAPLLREKRVVVGLLVAAVLICALIPAMLYLKNSDSNKDNAIAEVTTIEEIPDIEIAKTEEYPAIIGPAESPVITEKVKESRAEQPVRKTEIAEKPRTEKPQSEPVKPPESALSIEPERGTSIATAPPDTGVRLRGGGDPADDQPGTVVEQEQASNINIPPGLSSIFENMFANRNFTFVIIPYRITSIGKSAFAGNPLLSVTIGANVVIADNAIPGNFAAAYNAGGKAAGTYTRPDVNSEAWRKE